MATKSKNWQIIVVLGLFSLMSGVAGSSVNLALPVIGRELAISSGATTWIVQIGLITTAIFLVLFGHLGDLISKNYIFLYGGVFFVIGSILNGAAPDFWFLLFGRIVQSVGSAMIMANSMGIVTQYFPDSSRAEALAIISMFTAVGSISGPAIGGLIMGIASWRWIFWFNVPIGAIVLLFGCRALPTPKETFHQIREATKGANWTGQNIFTVGMIIFFLSGPILQQGINHLWEGLGVLVLGAVITVYAFIQDDHSKSPWISPAVLHNPIFMISVSALALTMMVNVFSNILLTFYLQSYGQLTPVVSGFILMLQSIIMLMASPIAGHLADKWNRDFLTIIGLVVLTISQVGYALYPTKMTIWQIVLPVILNGIGMGLFLSPNNALTMSIVDQKDTGVAGSFSSFARTLGMTVGISFASTVLFMQLPGVTRITPALGLKFVQAFRNVFWAATVISAFTLLVVFLRIYRTGKQAPKTATKAAS